MSIHYSLFTLWLHLSSPKIWPEGAEVLPSDNRLRLLSRPKHVRRDDLHVC